MSHTLSFYADDELAVLKEERLTALHDLRHRKSDGKGKRAKETDIVGEISLIDSELSFRKTLSKAQNRIRA